MREGLKTSYQLANKKIGVFVIRTTELYFYFIATLTSTVLPFHSRDGELQSSNYVHRNYEAANSPLINSKA